MSYFIYPDLISSLLDPKLVDPGSTLIHVSVYGPKTTLYNDNNHFVLDFIRGLLQNIGTHVDPIILIRRIPNNLEIPSLRDALVKILQVFISC